MSETKSGTRTNWTFGQSIEQYRYEPWGKPRSVALWAEISDASWAQIDRTEAASARGFTGHLMVDFANLIHAGGRIYDPVIARFTSIDPVVIGQANPEAYNRYSYVVNNPMNYNDPSGYFRSGTGIGGSIKRELKRFERKFKDQLLDFATGGLYSSVKYTSRELARFAEKNKFAGQILGVAGMVGCAYANVAAASCMTAFQGFTSGAIAYGSGGSFEDVLFAASKSAALAFANAHMAGQIGATTKGIQDLAAKSVVSGGLHGLRGGVFAMFAGADFRSGLVGGLTEGALAPSFGGSLGNAGHEVAVTALVSGSVSQITGGNFAIGAEQGAMGYLFNFLSQHGAAIAIARRNAAIAQASEAMSPDYTPRDKIMVSGGAVQVGLGFGTCVKTLGVGCFLGGGSMIVLGSRDVVMGWTGRDPLVQGFVSSGHMSQGSADNISLIVNVSSATISMTRGIYQVHTGKLYQSAETLFPVYTGNRAVFHGENH